MAGLRSIVNGQVVRMSIRGMSMRPHLVECDWIEVVGRRTYWPGDVLVFRVASDRFVAHRLLGYRRHSAAWSAITKGDALATPDSPIALHDVVGKVVAIGPGPLVCRCGSPGGSVLGRALTGSVWRPDL